MAKKSDVDFSVNGETQISEVENNIVSQIYSGAEYDEKFHIFKLVGNSRNGSVYIPNISDVINPATITDKNPKGVVERMRLIAGVPSVWIKDQKDLSPEYIRNNSRSLQFIRGTRMLRIPDNDSTALEFARLCHFNIGSKSRRTGSPFDFYEYDPAKEEREALEREDFELDMAIEAKQAKPESMRKHAAFLGIALTNSLGLPASDDGIRLEYTRYAKRNPKYFKDTLGSKQVDIGWLVRKAIVDAKIDLGREQGKVYWANGGGMIAVLPKGTEPVRELTDLAMTNTEDGMRFLEQLQTVEK